MINDLASLSCTTVLVKAKNCYNLVYFCLKMYPTDLRFLTSQRSRARSRDLSLHSLSMTGPYIIER